MAKARREPRQSWMIEQVMMEGELSALRAGQLYHADLGYHDEDEECEYCVYNGGMLLAQLIVKRQVILVDVEVRARISNEGE